MKIIIDPKDAEIVYVKCDDGYARPMYLVDIDPKTFAATPKTINEVLMDETRPTQIRQS